ncbi:cupin domain-containing protein [Kitasatospora sp. NPDC048194]|uniref:cupin domain-containing protein n=1 Tax=Kitasatospora sp. NPDC048194 TaxID=3364045 RepID=UPI0037123761
MAPNPGPGVLTHLETLLRETPPDRSGALWRLAEEGRQLDANIVRLAPHAEVAEHVEPDLDVLVQVLGGSGRLETDGGRQPLAPGATAWLPHGDRRALAAGPEGLLYLTVHRRRPGLSIRSVPLP